MAALRSGEFVPPPDDGYDPEADMRALRGAHKRKAKDAETYMSREQLMELRKVQAERVEVCESTHRRSIGPVLTRSRREK